MPDPNQMPPLDCEPQCGNTRAFLGKATHNQVAWVKDTLAAATHAAALLERQGLHRVVSEATIDGLFEGTLLRILDILNIEPDYTYINTKVR